MVVSNDLTLEANQSFRQSRVLSLRPDCVTKNSVTETILTLETIIWKPDLSSIFTEPETSTQPHFLTDSKIVKYGLSILHIVTKFWGETGDPLP